MANLDLAIAPTQSRLPRHGLEFLKVTVIPYRDKPEGLLIVDFYAPYLGQHFTYCPRWDELIWLVKQAVETEWKNTGIYRFEDMRKLLDLGQSIQEIGARNIDAALGREQRQIHRQLDQGNLRAIRNKLNQSALIEIIEYRQRMSI